MPRTHLGTDPDTGAEKYEVTDATGKVIGYDLEFPSE